MYIERCMHGSERGLRKTNIVIYQVAFFLLYSIPAYITGMLTGEIHYDTPELESILSNTYGQLVYQEQVIQTVQKLAGFTPGQADSIRKAMGLVSGPYIMETLYRAQGKIGGGCTII